MGHLKTLTRCPLPWAISACTRCSGIGSSCRSKIADTRQVSIVSESPAASTPEPTPIREVSIALPSDELSFFEFRDIALNRLLAATLIMLVDADADVCELIARHARFVFTQIFDEMTVATRGFGLP